MFLGDFKNVAKKMRRDSAVTASKIIVRYYAIQNKI